MNILDFMWKQIKGHRGFFVFAIITTVFTSLMGVVNPALMKYLVDDVIRGQHRDNLILLMLVMVGMHFSKMQYICLKSILWKRRVSECYII